MPEQEILNISGLKTYFRSDEMMVKAVDELSFSVQKGETIGIVGESGSGKSVTALSVMRLVPQPGGEIVGGQIRYHSPKSSFSADLLNLSEGAMQKVRGNEIAMIFQEPMTSLNPVYPCGNQVAETLMLHRDMNWEEARQEVLGLFVKVQLPDVKRIYEAYPHQLSGGHKQRVMIPMALSCNPGLLIADEPTTALDVTVQKATLDLMSELKNEYGTAIMFISHDLSVIAEIADRVVVMFKGKIVEQGPVKDIFLNPQHPYTKGLLSCRPPLDFRLNRLPVVADFMEVMHAEGQEPEIIEKKVSIKEVINKSKVTKQAMRGRLEKLQTQEQFLKVENIKN